MSYILDALRRADSERERGAIPGIHAQAAPLLSDEEAGPSRISPWVWAGAAAALIAVLAGALVWSLSRPEAAPARAVAQAPAAALPTGPGRNDGAPALPALPPAAALPDAAPLGGAAANPIAAPSANAAAPALPAGPAVAVAKPGLVARAAQAAGSAAAGLAARAPANPAAARRPASPASAALAARTEAVRAAAASSAGEPVPPPRLYAQHELPEEIRRGVPALVVNGSVFSKNPADRFLIINGQIVHEKEVVAPDVVLEQIKLRAAVLATKGYRFEITY